MEMALEWTSKRLRVREEVRVASSTIAATKEKGQGEDPVLLPKRENTRKETENKIPKGKYPKITVFQESQISRHATFSEGAMTKGLTACDFGHST